MPINTPRVPENFNTVWDRLLQLGYFSNRTEAAQAASDPESSLAQNAVERYQFINGLWQDGRLGPVTEAKMHEPRGCQCPDIMPRRRSLCKWPHLTIRVVNACGAIGLLSAADADAAFREGCGWWSKHSGMSFEFLTADTPRASANVHAEKGRTGRGIWAWSGLPCGADEDDTMDQTYSNRADFDKPQFREVSGHEVGHALGLDHGPSGRCVMQASGNLRNYSDLTSWDIAQIQKRYGPPPTPGPEPDPGPGPPADREIWSGEMTNATTGKKRIWTIFQHVEL